MSFRDIKRAILAANHTPVAIEGKRLDALAILGANIAHGRATDAEIAFVAAASAASPNEAVEHRNALAAKLAAPMYVPGPKGTKTAIVSFRGLVTYDLEYQPYAVSTRNFAANMQALANDDSVTSIVAIFDSPGGTVFGLPEAADAMYDARQKKRVIAAVDIVCASAAYYVASQASEISAMPSGYGVGSIGVRMMHMDCSQAMAEAGVKVTHIYSGQYKVEGNSFEPLSEEARARYQYECDQLYNDFLAAVARGRETTVEDVRENFGKGRVLNATEAKRVGMIDRLEPVEAAFRRAGVVLSMSAHATLDAPKTTEDVEPEVPASAEDPAPSTSDEVEQMVNNELMSKTEVDEAASAELDLMRRQLELAAY